MSFSKSVFFQFEQEQMLTITNYQGAAKGELRVGGEKTY